MSAEKVLKHIFYKQAADSFTACFFVNNFLLFWPVCFQTLSTYPLLKF
jgi:hypothetical protein